MCPSTTTVKYAKDLKDVEKLGGLSVGEFLMLSLFSLCHHNVTCIIHSLTQSLSVRYDTIHCPVLQGSKIPTAS